MDVEHLTVWQARELLSHWTEITARRDEIVRASFAAGVSKSEIHRLTGIARSTIDAILLRTTEAVQSSAVLPPAPQPRDKGQAPRPEIPPAGTREPDPPWDGVLR